MYNINFLERILIHDKQEKIQYFYRKHRRGNRDFCIHRLYSPNYRQFGWGKGATVATSVCGSILFDLGFIWLEQRTQERLDFNCAQCGWCDIGFFDFPDRALKTTDAVA